MLRSILASLALLFYGSLTLAQAVPHTLNSPDPANNSHNGIMLDVSATNDVTITGFDITVRRTFFNTPVEIYTRAGTHAGFETSSTGWTLLGTAHVSGAENTIANIPLLLSTPITSGSTQAFYITSQGENIGYRDTDSQVGATYLNDENLGLHVGTGKSYPFADSFAPREFVGAIHYTTAPVETPTPPAATPVPTLGTIGLLGLAAAMGAAGVAMNRRRKK